MKISDLCNIFEPIIEKRAHAEHPSQQIYTAYQQLIPYKDNPNIYISFTQIQKLGINPQSKYDTPIGIYTYPLKEIFPLMNNKASNVPFAGKNPYIYIVSSDQVKELSEYTSSEMDKDLAKINKIMKSYNFTDREIATLCNDAAKDAKIDNTGGRFWNITRVVSSKISKKINSKPVVVWNKLLQKMGYKAISDKKAQGIIHSSEKIQAVFFDIKAFKIIDMIRNKEFQKYSSKKDQLIAVQKNGNAIYYIIKNGINPSKEVQLAAVQQDGLAIRYIKNPSEEVKLAAVQQDISAIYYINNTSEVVQLAAVQKNGNAIEYIINNGINPSEEVQLAAVQQDGLAIRYIKNPSEVVQLAAVQKNGNAIYYIIKNGINPSKEVQLAAVKEKGSAIRYIKNPSEEVKAYINKGIK